MTGTLQPTYFSQYHAQSFKALLLQKSWQLLTFIPTTVVFVLQNELFKFGR